VRNMREPTQVWVIGTNPLSTPDKLSSEQIGRNFSYYSDTGFEPKLQWLYDTIGCRTVELVQLHGVGHLWVDEEGKLKEKRELNLLASELYARVLGAHEDIVGRAVLVVDPDEENASGIGTILGLISKLVARHAIEFLKLTKEDAVEEFRPCACGREGQWRDLETGECFCDECFERNLERLVPLPFAGDA